MSGQTEDTDDRARPLLLAQAAKRGAMEWRDDDVEPVIAKLLAEIDRHISAADLQLSEAVEREKKAEGWAKDWHGIVDTICTVLELGTLDADQVIAAVRAKFEKAERERVEQWNLRRDREASLMVEKAVTDSMRIERARYKRGLETLACTFYKDDQYQDYAKHVLDAARAALQGEPS